MSETLSDRLKNLIEQRGISQRSLAEQAGITEASVSHYIKGDRIPTAGTIAKIATALGTTPDYLLSGEPFTADEKLNDAILTIKQCARYLSYKQKLEIMESLLEKND